MLYAIELPRHGGETLFVHGGHALAALDPATRERVAALRAVHLYDPRLPLTDGRYRESLVGPGSFHAEHPVVQPHPYGQGSVLTVTYQHTDRIVGLDDEESDALLSELFAALYDSGGVYAHAWRPGDLVVWDNRVVQHGRGVFDPAEPRVLRRCVVGDEAGERQFISDWVALAGVG